jgi:hypothetical protein
MFVDLLQGRVFKGPIGALLPPPFLDFAESGPGLADLDAGELFQDPTFRGVVGELGFFRLEALIYCHHAFELFGIGAGVERDLFNQRQDRREGV